MLRIKIILLLNFVFFYGHSFAGEADTVLNMVLSKPYFYNVVQNDKGEIYVGSSNGIIKITGENLSHFGTNSGYVKIGKNGNPEIDSAGIGNLENQRYLYLLPYPSEKRQEYHTGNDQQFYMVSGGRLFIFDIVPYSITYRNQSIRSITKNFVGGYSGIYNKGEKLEYLSYTDGYIREYNDTAFICYGGLMVITPGKHENYLMLSNFGAYIDSVELGYMDDIFFDTVIQKYFLSTTNKGVYIMGKDFKAPRKIYAVQPGESVVFLGSIDSTFNFIVGNKFVGYTYKENRVFTKDSCIEKITCASIMNIRNFYTLSKQSLFVNSTTTFFSKIASFQDVHTFLALNEKDLVISGNQGLYLYNLETKTTSTIINGVEFNRKALYLNNNKLYAGSVNGLYTIDINQIPKLISRNKAGLQSGRSLITYVYWGIAVFLLVFIFLFAIIRLKRKLKTAEQKIIEVQSEVVVIKEKKLDKEMIEDFIRHNLATASIKTINDHFKTNTSLIYNLLEPDKPGTIIQKLRLELLAEMKKSGADAQQIAEATGLSESYVKKIRGSV